MGGTRLKPRVRGGLSPAAGSRGSRPTHPILQPSSNATPCGPSCCLSLEEVQRQAPSCTAKVFAAWSCEAEGDQGESHRAVRANHTLGLPYYIACHGEAAVSNTPRGFLYLFAGVAVIGKIGGHVRLLPLRKRKRKKNETLLWSSMLRPKCHPPKGDSPRYKVEPTA